MKVHKVDQRSSAWRELRRGIPCTSGFHNIITPKGAVTTGRGRKTYMYRLIAERLLQRSMNDSFENYWTNRGGELEPQAAAAFEQTMKVVLEDGCFITNDAGTLGCSPDRIVLTGDSRRAGLEMKCPAPWTQVGHLLDGPGDDYKPQVQGQLWIGEFEVMHFWSYHPQMPAFHRPTVRDEAYIERLRTEVAVFCLELDQETERARSLGIFTPGRDPPLELPGFFPWRGGNGNGDGTEFFP